MLWSSLAADGSLDAARDTWDRCGYMGDGRGEQRDMWVMVSQIGNYLPSARRTMVIVGEYTSGVNGHTSSHVRIIMGRKRNGGLYGSRRETRTPKNGLLASVGATKTTGALFGARSVQYPIADPERPQRQKKSANSLWDVLFSVQKYWASQRSHEADEGHRPRRWKGLPGRAHHIQSVGEKFSQHILFFTHHTYIKNGLR